ncbi:MAG: anhydro-N-acetylmuramic acid kinase, partial [Bacteroidota bacterium]
MKYYVVGAMAGSSMDGLDLALVSFLHLEESWRYEIIECTTVSYEEHLYEQLQQSSSLDQKQKEELDDFFGDWIGDQINIFLSNQKHYKVDLLAVHGHTVVHIPMEGISWQLGNGYRISKRTGIATVTDFRTLDIKEGGQGAPLVPYGDFELFRGYDACVNLGGIANVSLRDEKMAWDICPCNQILNFYAKKLGFEYDRNGELGRGGRIIDELIGQISYLDYFTTPAPKSLPNGFIPFQILDTVDPVDGLRSCVEFIAKQIFSDLSVLKKPTARLLITGGGAFNAFLVERIKHY